MTKKSPTKRASSKCISGYKYVLKSLGLKNEQAANILSVSDWINLSSFLASNVLISSSSVVQVGAVFKFIVLVVLHVLSLVLFHLYVVVVYD